jgi:hypothetical protein
MATGVEFCGGPLVEVFFRSGSETHMFCCSARGRLCRQKVKPGRSVSSGQIRGVAGHPVTEPLSVTRYY